MLRLPPNSLSREAICALELFTGINPISIPEYSASCMFRFAFSERRYLYELFVNIKDRVFDSLPFSEHRDYFLPKGSIPSHSILHNLINCLHFQGFHSRIPQVCSQDPSHRWILNEALPSFQPVILPPNSKGLQSACIRVLNYSSAFHSSSSLSAFPWGVIGMLLKSSHPCGAGAPPHPPGRSIGNPDKK